MQGGSGISRRLVEADIERFLRKCGEAIAIEARLRIYKYAQEEMADYYEEYKPVSKPEKYTRTNQMLLHSYIPFSEKVGNVYSGGVKIDFDHPPTSHEIWGKDFDESSIYGLVWQEGLHPIGYPVIQGYRVADFIGSGVDHENRLRIKAYADKENIYQKGIQEAKKAKYSTITFR